MQDFNHPKVSIITAVKNNADFISRAIVSVINQTYENIQHIIIDNNSDDGTDQVVEKLNHANMIYIREKDSGIYDALNKGIKNSKGQIIGFLHADDVLKIALTKELKKVDWVEVDISKNDEKSQASIQ